MTSTVSVIIPCYNYGAFLSEAVHSVLHQTHQDIDCIIVNDGSTDNTATVAMNLAATDPRINYIERDNGGISAARNTGIEHAKGDYLQFLDADDILPPLKLERQLALFTQMPDIDTTYGNARFFHSEDRNNLLPSRNGSPSKTAKLKISGKGISLVNALVINNFIDTAAPLLKREVVEKVGPFDTNYKTYEDWQYWFRCALSGVHFYYEAGDDIDYLSRIGHTSLMSNTKQLISDGIRIRQFMRKYLKGSPLASYNEYRILKLRIKDLLLQ